MNDTAMFLVLLRAAEGDERKYADPVQAFEQGRSLKIKTRIVSGCLCSEYTSSAADKYEHFQAFHNADDDVS